MLWVSDDRDRRIYVYSLRLDNYGRRMATQEFRPTTANGSPKGLWSDGTHMWVADKTDDKIYAYTLNGERQSQLDINTLNAADNDDPTAIWSNGHTMWVADGVDQRIYAYRLSDGARQVQLEYDDLAAGGVVTPKGIWSDGELMYVSDNVTNSLYTFISLESSDSVTSLSLFSGMSEIAFGTFDHNVKDYEARVPRSVSQVTVEYEAMTGVVVSITPADADDATDGHQVSTGLAGRYLRADHCNRHNGGEGRRIINVQRRGHTG